VSLQELKRAIKQVESDTTFGMYDKIFIDTRARLEERLAQQTNSTIHHRLRLQPRFSVSTAMGRARLPLLTWLLLQLRGCCSFQPTSEIVEDALLRNG